jgi:succinate dehydrogenase / fumarate reductase cytochrome b subunit
MALTGLLLVGFLVTHLLGNLLLYSKDPVLFNGYAEKLAALGPLLYVAEAGLAAFFLYHAFTGIRLALLKRKASPDKYAVRQSKGGGSKWGISANNMMITGSVLLVFLVLHIIHMKYGPNIEEGYAASLTAGGPAVRDLHRLAVEEFKKPVITVLYSVVMILLGFHLRHGIWSGFQSLGLTRETNSKTIYLVGGAIGILLAVGFLTIPAYIYFFH